MSYIKNSQRFYINSHNRTSGTHSNFLIKVPLDVTKTYDSVCVLAASIPKSYYLIPQGRNTFTLQEEKKTATITVTPGNYSARTFATALTTLLNAASPNGLTYSITAPSSTSIPNNGKFVFTVGSGPGINPSFVFAEYLYEQMGFDPNSTNNFSSYSLTSTNVINMQLEDTLMLHSDIADNQQNNILQDIYCANVPDFGKIDYFCTDVEAQTRPLSTQNNNVYSFSLSDEDGNAIDTNGQNVVITLLVYKKDTLMREWIQYQAKNELRKS